MITKVIMVFPLVEREYTDRENRKQVFASKGLVLHDGKSSIYAEAIQEQAREVDKLDLQVGEAVSAHIQCRVREYTDSQGTKRVSNEITLTNLMRF